MPLMDSLEEKLGPLPVWAWGGVGAVGVAAFLLISRNTEQKAVGQLPTTQTIATNDPSGTATSVNSQLTAILSRLQGEGTYYGPGGVGNAPAGVTSAGLSAASVLKSMGAGSFSDISGLESDFNTKLGTVYSDTLKQTGNQVYSADAATNAFLTGRNELAHLVEQRITQLQDTYYSQEPYLSASDAAHVRDELTYQTNNLRGIESVVVSHWQTTAYGSTAPYAVGIQSPIHLPVVTTGGTT